MTEPTAPPPPPESQPSATPPPPAAPAAPAAPASASASAPAVAVGPAMIVGVVAAVVVFVTIFLSWLSFEVGPESVSEKGTDVPVMFLWDTIPADDDPSLLVALAPIAVLILVGALVAKLRVLAIVGGGLAIVVAILFVIQTGNLLDEFGFDLGTFDAIGIAPYLAFAGGIGGVVAGVLPRRT